MKPHIAFDSVSKLWSEEIESFTKYVKIPYDVQIVLKWNLIKPSLLFSYFVGSF